MIKPTVGRVVWFTPTLGGDPGFVHIDRMAPLAAIVAHVWHDRMVNLTVFDSNGAPFGKTSVQLLQDDDAKPEYGYFCSWMPYQVGQAAKHAAEVKPSDSVGVWLAGCAAPVPATAAIPGPGLSFGGAIEALQLGQRVSRAGWNGKGMWLALQVPDANSKMSLPYIYMKTADDKQVPWLASQTDVLANDWSVA